MQRFSKKRQSILDLLKSTKSHPTAEWVYKKLKPVYPNLSLGTVYRNLNALKESGEIKSIGKVDGKERFDATTVPHSHLVCKKCGKILDVNREFLSLNIIKKVKEETGFNVESLDVQFTGLCSDCMKKGNKKYKF